MGRRFFVASNKKTARRNDRGQFFCFMLQSDPSTTDDVGASELGGGSHEDRFE